VTIPATPPPSAASAKLPQWALDAIQLYEASAANQFVIFGNVNDPLLIPSPAPHLGGLTDFLLQVLLPRFDVVLSYDIGNGIRVEKGGETFSRWPRLQQDPNLPKAPRPAVETLTQYFRYTANLARLNRERVQVGCILKSADLLAPAVQRGFDYDLNPLASLIRDWSSENLLAGHSLATFHYGKSQRLASAHRNNPLAARIKIALPAR
jgi:hypothetical protein